MVITARPVTGDGRTLAATVEVDDAVHDLWWEVTYPPTLQRSPASPTSPTSPTSAAGDVLVAATLLPAALGGHELRIEAPVSAQLVRGAATVSEVFAIWARRRQLETDAEPGYRRTRVQAAGTRVSGGGSGRVAAMFSAGVDSFHTVLRHRHRLDALVYVVGFDVRLGSPPLEGALARVRAAAAQLGLPLIEVRTNLRDVLDAYVPWDDLHGAALATVGLLLGDEFAEVLVPATHTYDDLYPLGSHPVVETLWSNGDVVLSNDGGGFDRADKLAAIATMAAARANVRVCFQFVDGALNCGRCEKCVRTLVGARIGGVAGAFDTLPDPGTVRLLARVLRTVPLHRATTWRWYRLRLRREVRDPLLRLAVSVALWRWQWRRWWGRRRGGS